MNKKQRAVNQITISEESKQYIRDNCNSIGKKQIQERLKISHKTLTDFMNEEGLQGRYDKKGLSNFKVNEPKIESKPNRRKSGNFDVDDFTRGYKY